MNTDFPEDIFLPHNISLYKHKLDIGREICKNKSILFCGIARDVGDVLQRNIDCLHRTAKQFKDYQIFIYENNSIDNTKQILKSNKSNKLNYVSENRDDSDYKFKITNGEDPWHYNRCVILAECRNKYLEYFQSIKNKYDYLCILDFDLKGGWSYEGILHGIFTLEQENNIACVSSYGVLADKTGEFYLEDIDPKKYLMYDSFVFRPKGWNSGLHFVHTATFNNIQLDRNSDPFEVESNFNGMAIYKTSCIDNIRYGAKEWSTGYVDADHVVFNRQLRNQGWKILLDPSMITSYSRHKYSIGEKC